MFTGRRWRRLPPPLQRVTPEQRQPARTRR